MAIDEMTQNDPGQEEPTVVEEVRATEQSFAELLEEYDVEPLHRGQLVEGEIVKIDTNVIFVDVGAKRTAVIPPDDLVQVDEAIRQSLSEGDKVLLYILRTPVGDQDLLVSLQKGLEQQDWLRAEEALADESMLELEVVGHNKGGMLVSFGNLRGFIPNSHLPDLQHIHDRRQLTSAKSKLVGENLPLKVIEVDRERRRLVLSMKAAQSEVRERRLRELQIGEVISGRVASIVDFGVFVDLGGVDGLVHISNLAWQQVAHPSDVLQEGEEIDVLVESVDVERERVSLNRKVLLPNPWHQFAEDHEEGELIEGVVTKVLDFGAFVQVAPGIEGLVHVSEIRIFGTGAPQDVLQTGDVLLVRILSIDPERERLGLSQRRVGMQEEMEWMQRRPTAPDALPDEPAADDAEQPAEDVAADVDDAEQPAEDVAADVDDTPAADDAEQPAEDAAADVDEAPAVDDAESATAAVDVDDTPEQPGDDADAPEAAAAEDGTAEPQTAETESDEEALPEGDSASE